MENRDAVLADYFKLRVLLNRTNQIRDQKTDIDFIAHFTGPFEYKILATLKGVKDQKYIELCRRGSSRRWEPAEYSGLTDLENFCVVFLKKSLNQNFSYDELKSVVDLLKKDLQGLGIS